MLKRQHVECGGADVVAAVAYNYGRYVAWLRVCVRKSHSDLENFGERSHPFVNAGLRAVPSRRKIYFLILDFYLFLYKCNIRLCEVAGSTCNTYTSYNSTANMIGATYVVTTFYYCWRQSVCVSTNIVAAKTIARSMFAAII